MAPANTAAEQPFSTGLLLGNGRQASHWFPDEQDPNNTLIGQLDPTLAAGGNPTFPAVINISGADLRALDVIGWDIGQIPEPSSLLVAAALAMACGGMRRRH